VKPSDFPLFLQISSGPLLLWQWLGLGVSLAIGCALGFAVGRALIALGRRLARRTPLPWDDEVVEASSGAVKAACSLLAFHGLAQLLGLPERSLDHLDKLVRAGLALSVVWGSIRALYAVGEAVSSVDVKDTLDPERLATARSRRTQVLLAIRVLSVLISVVGVALTALQFEVVRSVGVSLLASAGVASVVLGVAAQRSLGAILAGIQLSISQPIRIGDAVVFQGEHGTIEDIGLTYVAIRLWDERRLLVPTPRLLEEPIENWSRSRAGLVGTVFLPVHPRLPLDVLRSALRDVLASESLWDGRLQEVSLADVTEQAARVRILVSASHPGALGDLRYRVRERLLEFLSVHESGRFLPEPRLRIHAAAAPTRTEEPR